MTESVYPVNHERLVAMMQRVGINSLEELSDRSGIFKWQLLRLQCGLLPKLRIEILLKLSQTLNVSPLELVSTFSPESEVSSQGEIETNTHETEEKLAAIKQEYDKLQQDFEQQKIILEQEFQQSSFSILESLLLQLPTAAAAATDNPEFSASNLLPLLGPLTDLLDSWGIEAIETVGDMVEYNPQFHELIEGEVEEGTLVKVRYVGYQKAGRLLHRAKVSAENG